MGRRAGHSYLISALILYSMYTHDGSVWLLFSLAGGWHSKRVAGSAGETRMYRVEIKYQATDGNPYRCEHFIVGPQRSCDRDGQCSCSEFSLSITTTTTTTNLAQLSSPLTKRPCPCGLLHSHRRWDAYSQCPWESSRHGEPCPRRSAGSL